MDELFEIETDEVKLSWHAPAGAPRKMLTGLFDEDGYLKVTAFRNSSSLKVRKQDLPELVSRDPAQNAGPHLFEQTNYKVLVQSKSAKKISVRHSDPNIQNLFTAKDDDKVLFASVNFRSEVGFTTFSIVVDNNPEFEFTVEVYPSKIG